MKRKKKYFSIMIFSGLEGKCQKFKLSANSAKFILYLTSFIFIVFVAFSTFFINRYFLQVKGLKELSSLRHQTVTQKKIIDSFTYKIKAFENQIDKLEVFDRRIRSIITTGEENSDEVNGGSKKSIENEGNMLKKNISSSLNFNKEQILNDSFDQLNRSVKARLVSFQGINSTLNDQRLRLKAIPSIWPVRGWITSGFGFRKSPFTGFRDVHEGIDIAAASGAPIVAPANGVVVKSAVENGYGNVIEIDHGFGITTKFGHNSKNFIKIGTKVKRGQLIATVGRTGKTTGAHLHYEVLLNGVPVDPTKFLLND